VSTRRPARQIIIRPVITEESVEQLQQGKYTFVVDAKATKPEIKAAIKEIFNVDVARVNTMNYRGKRRRVRFQWGRRPDWKKAIVTLAEGQEIREFFEEIVS